MLDADVFGDGSSKRCKGSEEVKENASFEWLLDQENACSNGKF